MRAKRAKLLSNGVATGSHTDLNAQLFLDGGQRSEIGGEQILASDMVYIVKNTHQILWVIKSSLLAR